MLENQFPNNFHPNGEPILQSEAENIHVGQPQQMTEDKKSIEGGENAEKNKEDDWDSKFN